MINIEMDELVPAYILTGNQGSVVVIPKNSNFDRMFEHRVKDYTPECVRGSMIHNKKYDIFEKAIYCQETEVPAFLLGGKELVFNNMSSLKKALTSCSKVANNLM